jgi:DNA-binding response OmpR family regulator
MRKKILIADDDRDLVEVLSARLDAAGFDTMPAYEGIRAVEVAHKEKPDLILLDWKMPAGRGSDVLKDLKTKTDTKHIPVIILTGVSEGGIEETAYQLGAKLFLKKPCDAKFLIKKINEILEWKLVEETIG